MAGSGSWSAASDLQRPEPVGDVSQGHRLELAAPADGLLVESDRLLGGLPCGGELIQGPLAVKVLHRGDAAGVDVRAQVAPRHELLQGLGQLLIGVDPEIRRDVFWPQVDDEALLRSREGTQQAPVKVGVRDPQVRERLWLALTTRRLGVSADHHYMVPYGTDKMSATRHPGVDVLNELTGRYQRAMDTSRRRPARSAE